MVVAQQFRCSGQHTITKNTQTTILVCNYQELGLWYKINNSLFCLVLNNKLIIQSLKSGAVFDINTMIQSSF